MSGPEKICAVVLRQGMAGLELLVFAHPLAGTQIIKGSVEPGEPHEAAAHRELFEESGLAALSITGRLPPLQPCGEGPLWHFRLFDGTGLPEGWTHHCSDDGGHDFRFFWHGLDDAPTAEWHPVFVDALRHVRTHLALGKTAE